MSLEVADLTAALGLNATSFDRGMSAAENKARTGSKSIGLALGGVAAAGGAALVAGLTASVNKARDFQTVMSGVGAVSGATTTQMAGLNTLALKLGKDTTYSATQAGSALEELVKGGVSIADIMNGGAKATLNLAAAGSVDLPSAAEIAANAMNIFGISGKKMAHVTDMIAGAANASSLDVMDFKFSLAASGAVAEAMGFNFDDLSVAIAEMGAAGLKGADAGTSLKTMFLALNPKSDAAAGAMRDLGIITKDGANRFFDAAGHAKKLADVQEVLRQATKGMTDQQRIASLETIFGTDAIRAASILTRDGAAGFDKMAASMGKVTAASVAAERMNNLDGKMQALSGSVETLEVTVGTALIPTLTDLASTANDVVGGFLDITNAMPPGMLELATKIAGAAGAVLALSGGMSLLSGAAAPIAGLITGIGAPVIALGAGLAALTLAWSQDWGHIREKVQAAWQGIQPAIGAIKGAVADVAAAFKKGGISSAAQTALGDVQKLLPRFASWLTGVALPQITTHLASWGHAFVGWVSPRIPALLSALGTLGKRVTTWVTGTALPDLTKRLSQWGGAFVAWVAPHIPPLINEVGGLAKRLGTWAINTALPDIAKKLSQWGQAFVGWVSPHIAPLVSALGGLLTRVGGWAVNTALPDIKKKLGEWGTAFMGWVGPRIPGLLTNLGDLSKKVIAWVGKEVPALGKALAGWATSFAGWTAPIWMPLQTQLNHLGDQMVTWITGAAGRIEKNTDKWAQKLADWIVPVNKGIPSKMGTYTSGLDAWMKTKGGAAMSRLAGALANAFGTAIGDAMKNEAANIGQTFMDGLWDQNPIIQPFIQGGAATLSGFGDLLATFKDIGVQLMQGLADGITGMASTVTDAIGGVGNDAIDSLRGLLGISSPSKVFFGLGINTIAGFIGGVTARAGALLEAVASAFRPLPGLAMGVGGAVAGNARTAWQLATQPGFGGTVVGGQAAVGRAILVIHDGIAKSTAVHHAAAQALHAKTHAVIVSHETQRTAMEKRALGQREGMLHIRPRGEDVQGEGGRMAREAAARMPPRGFADGLMRALGTQVEAAVRQRLLGEGNQGEGAARAALEGLYRQPARGENLQAERAITGLIQEDAGVERLSGILYEQAQRHAAVVARAAARHQAVLAATAKRHADHLARLAADAQGVADRKADRAAAASVMTTSGTRITAHAPGLAVAGLPAPSGGSGGAISITVNISPHAIEVSGGGGIDGDFPEELGAGLVEYTRALLQSRKNAGRRAAVSMPGAR